MMINRANIGFVLLLLHEFDFSHDIQLPTGLTSYVTRRDLGFRICKIGFRSNASPKKDILG